MNVGSLTVSPSANFATSLLRLEASEAAGRFDRDGDADDATAQALGPSGNGLGQTVVQTISVSA